MREQAEKTDLRQQSGLVGLGWKLVFGPATRGEKRHLVDGGERAIEERRARREQITIVRIPGQQMIDDGLQRLLLRGIRDRLAELRIYHRILRQRLVQIELQHVGEERSRAGFDRGDASSASDLSLESLPGVESHRMAARKQLFVRRRVPQQVRQPRGLRVAVQAQPHLAFRIAFGSFDPKQELGRGEQARECKLEACDSNPALCRGSGAASATRGWTSCAVNGRRKSLRPRR